MVFSPFLLCVHTLGSDYGALLQALVHLFSPPECRNGDGLMPVIPGVRGGSTQTMAPGPQSMALVGPWHPLSGCTTMALGPLPRVAALSWMIETTPTAPQDCTCHSTAKCVGNFVRFVLFCFLKGAPKQGSWASGCYNSGFMPHSPSLASGWLGGGRLEKQPPGNIPPPWSSGPCGDRLSPRVDCLPGPTDLPQDLTSAGCQTPRHACKHTVYGYVPGADNL